MSTRRDIIHMAENGDHYIGVETTLEVGGLRFVSFAGYPLREAEFRQLEDAYPDGPAILGAWVYDEDEDELAEEEVLL